MEDKGLDPLDVSFTSSAISSTSSSSFHSVDDHKATVAGASTDAEISPTEFMIKEETRRVVIYEATQCVQDDDVEEISDGQIRGFRYASCETTPSPHRPEPVRRPAKTPPADSTEAYKEPQPADTLQEPGAKRAEPPQSRRNVASETVSTETSSFVIMRTSPTTPQRTPSPRVALASASAARTPGSSSTSPAHGRQSPRPSPRVRQCEAAALLSSMTPVNQAEALAQKASVSEASARMLAAYRKVKHNTRQRIFRIFYDRWLLFLEKPQRRATVGTQTRARLHRRSHHRTHVDDVEELDTKCLSSNSSNDWTPKAATTALEKRQMQEREEEEERLRRQREKEAEEERRRREREEQQRSIQPISSPPPMLTLASHAIAFPTPSPPPGGIAAKSRPADELKDNSRGSDLPPRKRTVMSSCDVSTDLSSVVQHPIRVTRF